MGRVGKYFLPDLLLSRGYNKGMCRGESTLVLLLYLVTTQQQQQPAAGYSSFASAARPNCGPSAC